MVSQGAQTNGMLINGRKLMKSYSEASRFANNAYSPEILNLDTPFDHEPLQRTQSDEPPRSPFIVTSPPPLPIQLETVIPQSDTSSLTRSDHESEDSEEKCQKEIFIDFKPQLALKQAKKPLMKTQSDGEILLDQRKALRSEDGIVPEKSISSMSHENIMTDDEPRSFTPYFTNIPIRHEGIFKDLDERVFSSVSDSFDDQGLMPQDSIDEEFHERLIYGRMYLRRDGSTTSEHETIDSEQNVRKPETLLPEDESVVPSLSLLPDRKLSPFASSDSLANDIR